MRAILGVLLALTLACSNGGPAAAPDAEVQAPPSRSIADLEFDDPELQRIATALVAEAQRRGIEESTGATRVERLLDLEGKVGGSRALKRVEWLVGRLTFTDGTQWAKLRRRAENEFHGKNDEVARRVNELMTGWKRERLNAAMRFLSSHYGDGYIHSREWERRFADYVAARPLDAATWGWLVAREHQADVAAQYGRSDAESAYRFYLEFSGLGTNDDAERVFSVPGIEIKATAAR